MAFRKVKCSLLLCCLVYANHGNAQNDSSLTTAKTFGIAAGLGISLVNATDVVDFIKEQSNQQSKLDDFTTAAEFFGLLAVRLNDEWGLTTEYAYLLKSYNVSQMFASDVQYSYGVHMPTIMIQYLVLGKGYAFKFGGGLGYHFARFTEEYSYGSKQYSSKGVGIKLDAEGNTEFDEHLFAHIGIDVRDDLMSEFRDEDGMRLNIVSRNRNATMGFFSLGLKFGLIYYF